MEAAVSNLPNDVEALKALVVSMTRRATDAEAELANARAKTSADQALIAHLKLQIAKLNRERFGPHSERSRRLLDQLELQLEELEASASEDDLAAEMAAAKTTSISAFERKRPAKKPSRTVANAPRSWRSAASASGPSAVQKGCSVVSSRPRPKSNPIRPATSRTKSRWDSTG